MTDNAHVHPGALVHFLESVTVPTDDSFGAVLARGATLELTEQLIEAGTDRTGANWLDLLGLDDAQVERWGEVRFRPGPWPEGEAKLVHGAPDWQDAREQARKAAWRIEDPMERAAARAEVEAVYGPALSTVTTLREVHS